MPAKNSRKIYVENGYYHIYNRGVEKRVIFLDEQDYSVFLSYLKEYFSPKDELILRGTLSDHNSSSRDKDRALKKLRMNNFAGEITLIAYCLMPNHFHMFLKQNSFGSIDKFMNSLGTRYTIYFNKKYKRTGTLYEGVYRAVLIKEESQFVYLSRYIHRQAILPPRSRFTKQTKDLEHLYIQPCSYPEYLGLRKTAWIHPEDILSYFSVTNPALSYRDLVEDDKTDGKEILRDILLEM
jgi:putative transposase